MSDERLQELRRQVAENPEDEGAWVALRAELERTGAIDYAWRVLEEAREWAATARGATVMGSSQGIPGANVRLDLGSIQVQGTNQTDGILEVVVLRRPWGSSPE